MRSPSRNLWNDHRAAYAIGGVCLVAVVGILIWLSMPAPQVTRKQLPPDPFQNPTAGMAYIRKLAATYGTDFDRLSNDDRLFLNSIAMGHGRELLANTVRELRAESPDRGTPANTIPTKDSPTPAK